MRPPAASGLSDRDRDSLRWHSEDSCFPLSGRASHPLARVLLVPEKDLIPFRSPYCQRPRRGGVSRSACRRVATVCSQEDALPAAAAEAAADIGVLRLAFAHLCALQKAKTDLGSLWYERSFEPGRERELDCVGLEFWPRALRGFAGLALGEKKDRGRAAMRCGAVHCNSPHAHMKAKTWVYACVGACPRRLLAAISGALSAIAVTGCFGRRLYSESNERHPVRAGRLPSSLDTPLDPELRPDAAKTGAR